MNKLIRAYLLGRKHSAVFATDLDVAEDRYARAHSYAEVDAYVEGWVHYAADMPVDTIRYEVSA